MGKDKPALVPGERMGFRQSTRDRKAPASKKITYSVVIARERITQWQFPLR